MSAWAVTWAYEQDVKPCGKKSVLVALAHFADAEGFCYPSQETLAGMTAQGISTVRTHLESLETEGFIKRQHRYKKGKRTSDGLVLQAPAERLQPQQNYRQKSAVVHFELPPEKGCTTAEKPSVLPPKSGGDLLVDQSVIQEPPLPPKRSHRQPEPEFVLAPPFDNEVFNAALSAYETHTRQRGGKITPAQREELYRVLLQCGSEQTATDALKMAVRCGWKGVFPERLSGNGNGHKNGREQPYSGPVKSVPNPRLDNCPDCRGMGNMLKEIDGRIYAIPCKHERSGVVAA